jgi:hypothetical protein
LQHDDCPVVMLQRDAGSAPGLRATPQAGGAN